jgi:hypothetical protein
MTAKKKGHPSWRNRVNRPHEGSLKELPAHSILKVHRGARAILYESLVDKKLRFAGHSLCS